jgi:hypothetical protein
MMLIFSDLAAATVPARESNTACRLAVGDARTSTLPTGTDRAYPFRLDRPYGGPMTTARRHRDHVTEAQGDGGRAPVPHAENPARPESTAR